MAQTGFFKFDPDWEAFAIANQLPVPTNEIPKPGDIKPLDIDFVAARPYQAQADEEWAAAHTLESVGYTSRLTSVQVRDGATVSVKVSCPDATRLKIRGDDALLVLFVCHGGGWVSGSHASEEAWLLWPLYKHFDLIIVSVEYRLGPENPFPTWIEDSWDVLQKLIEESASFVSELGVACDLNRLILAGSSAGGVIVAVLSQRCRDQSIPILGVVLNVPVLCHYKHFPGSDGTSDSYKECTQTFLGSREMATCWNIAVPSATLGADPMASPLLGNIANLPQHLIFAAGRDSLRDEAILYAEKLENSNVSVKLQVYPGVPHNFAHYKELKATVKFQQDLQEGLASWL